MMERVLDISRTRKLKLETNKTLGLQQQEEEETTTIHLFLINLNRIT